MTVWHTTRYYELVPKSTRRASAQQLHMLSVNTRLQATLHRHRKHHTSGKLSLATEHAALSRVEARPASTTGLAQRFCP